MSNRLAHKSQKNTARFPCGKLKPQHPEINWTAIIQRAANLRLGNPLDAAEAKAWHDCACGKQASFAVGVLLLRGLIDQREFDAAEKYEGIISRWQTLSGAPSRRAATSSVGVERGGASSDENAKEWAAVDRLRQRISATIRVRSKQHRLVEAALESVVLDGVLPPDSAMRIALPAIRIGLAILADFFILP